MKGRQASFSHSKGKPISYFKLIVEALGVSSPFSASQGEVSSTNRQFYGFRRRRRIVIIDAHQFVIRELRVGADFITKSYDVGRGRLAAETFI